MSDAIDAQQLAQQIAAEGRQALLERLRGAYTDAAAAHSDIVAVDHDRIEAMVQSAAGRADGLQWRRALATVASERLGISVTDALNHPAVVRAQELVGAPSYEESLTELIARPVPPPAPVVPDTSVPEASDVAEPSASEAGSVPDVIPGQEELFPAGAELEEVEADDEDLELMPEPLPEELDGEPAELPADHVQPPPRPGFEPPSGYIAADSDYEDEEILSSNLESIEADDAVFDLLPSVDPAEFEAYGAEEMPLISETTPPPLLESVPYVPDDEANEPKDEEPGARAGDIAAAAAAAAIFTAAEVAGANAATQVYQLPSDKAAAEPEAEPEPESALVAPEPELEDPQLDESELDEPNPALESEPEPEEAEHDPFATQVHDMAAEFAAQDHGDDAPPPTPTVDQPTAGWSALADADQEPLATAEPTAPADPGRADGPIPPWEPPHAARQHDERDAIDFFDEEPFADDDYLPAGPSELRVTAQHLGGVANLPTRGDGLDLRLSESGLDILQPNEEIIGRLQWSEIHALETSSTRGRLLGKSRSAARLIVRTRHGDATFEVPGIASDELKTQVDALAARYGSGR